MKKKLYDLKGTGLEQFDKLREGMEAIGFVQSKVDPCIQYREDMVLLFYFDIYLMFGPSKNEIDDVYDSLQADFNI